MNLLTQWCLFGFVIGLFRITQRATRKTSRYADPSSSVPAPRTVSGGNMYFLIPFPRTVFDTGLILLKIHV